MPCGPKTYGRQRGRPKKREGKKAMNDKDYEMIGESIWDTYKRMASLLAETEEGEQSRTQKRAIETLKVKKHGKGQGELKENPHTSRPYFTDDPRAPRSKRKPLYPGEPSNLGRDDVPKRSRGK